MEIKWNTQVKYGIMSWYTDQIKGTGAYGVSYGEFSASVSSLGLSYSGQLIYQYTVKSRSGEISEVADSLDEAKRRAEAILRALCGEAV